jgi:hypothetical protein
MISKKRINNLLTKMYSISVLEVCGSLPRFLNFVPQEVNNKQELEEKLQYIKLYIENKMNEHGLVRGGWNYSILKQKQMSKLTAMGKTSFEKKLIFISYDFILNFPIEAIKNTILHEIAHALTPGHEHDDVWRNVAIQIGCDGKVFNDYGNLMKPALLICKNHIYI